MTKCQPEISIYPEEMILLLNEDKWSWRFDVIDVIAAFRLCEVLMRTEVDIITLNYPTIFCAFSEKIISGINKIDALRYLFEHIDKKVYKEILKAPIPEALLPYANLSDTKQAYG